MCPWPHPRFLARMCDPATPSNPVAFAERLALCRAALRRDLGRRRCSIWGILLLRLFNSLLSALAAAHERRLAGLLPVPDLAEPVGASNEIGKAAWQAGRSRVRRGECRGFPSPNRSDKGKGEARRRFAVSRPGPLAVAPSCQRPSRRAAERSTRPRPLLRAADARRAGAARCIWTVNSAVKGLLVKLRYCN